MADFRTERMPSPEGEGRAKDALEAGWSAYYRTNKAINDPIYAALPFLRNIGKGYTASRVFDLFGFWAWWRICGGFEGVQKQLGLSRSAVFRRVALFREVFGEHPDVFEFPGISVDPVAFAEGMAKWSEDRSANSQS